MAGARRGWWRRNWWGLLAVVPVLAAAVLVSPTEPYQQWRGSQLRHPVAPAADGWVDYGGNRIALVALEPADLRTALSEPFPLPAGLRAWQVTVGFGRLADPDEALLSCEFRLEDDAGRLFGDSPEQVSDARLGPDLTFISSAYCGPDDDELEAETFQRVAVFVMPTSSDPVALRLSGFEQRPAYARFPVGGSTGTAIPAD